MQETIRRWGVGGILAGAAAGFVIILIEHIRSGVIKSVVYYPLAMLYLSVPGAVIGLLCGLVVALIPPG